MEQEAVGPMNVEFLLNGRRVSAQGYSSQTTLLDFVRSRGLTGAKEGCAEGECGACNVVCVAPGQRGTEFRAVNSCLMFLPMVSGQEIYTVEALAEKGELAAVQKAMADGGGSQCGYCTPGFVMSLFAEYYRPGRTGACDPHSMAGNLCRCTGYRPIRDAALSLHGAVADDRFTRRLSRPAPPLGRASCEGFLRPTSVEECLGELQKPGAKLIAGGTDLGVESNLRFRRWPRLISVEALFREFSDMPDRIRIGASLPLTDLAERWTGAPAAFHEWLTLFASPTLRNRATLGGSLATASPIGDSAPLLLALDAWVELIGPRGSRNVAVDNFFTGYRETVLEPNELISAVEIPKPLPSMLRFYKIAKRRMDDISTVAAALALDFDAQGRVRTARFGFGGVAATPVRATGAEDAVSGRTWNLDAVERAQVGLEKQIRPLSDHRGSAAYRLEVSKSLLAKFHEETT
jgi:xanthine dehydrogenase small subunit